MLKPAATVRQLLVSKLHPSHNIHLEYTPKHIRFGLGNYKADLRRSFPVLVMKSNTQQTTIQPRKLTFQKPNITNHPADRFKWGAQAPILTGRLKGGKKKKNIRPRCSICTYERSCKSWGHQGTLETNLTCGQLECLQSWATTLHDPSAKLSR